MIDRINIQLQPQAVLNQEKEDLAIHSNTNEKSATYLKADFCESYSIELKRNKKGKPVLVLTAGGIHREMDLQTLQHLVAMTY